MPRPRIVHQPTEWLETDTSLPDVLMTIELRSACGFGVVTVPDVDVLETDRVVEELHGFPEARRSGDVISRNMRMAHIDARPDGNRRRQMLHQHRHLLKTAAE